MTWEKPPQGPPAHSSEGTADTMEATALRGAAESLCHARPGSLHSSPRPTTTQFLNLAEVIPGAGRCVPQLLRGQPVSRGDIQTDSRSDENERETGCGLEARQTGQEAERARSQRNE